MDWYWVLLEQTANFVEAMMMVVLVNSFFEPKRSGKWPFIVFACTVYLMILLLNILKTSIVINLSLYVAVGIGFGFLFFRGSAVGHVLLPLLMVALLQVSELMTVGVLSAAFQNADQQFMQWTEYRLLGIIVSKVLLIGLVYTVGRFSRKEQSRIPMGYSLCLLAIPLISVICLVTVSQYVMYTATRSHLSPLWFAFTAVGLLFVNVLVIYLFQAIMNYSRTQSQYELMAQQADMLSKHLREKNALQEETHRIWHDMKNHFTVIQWMAKSRSFDKLEQYMLTLNETVESSMLKVQTGNPVLDALLNPKAVEAKAGGIEMTVNAAVPSTISIDDIDLNIVFSNALDNALEACKKLPDDQEKFISIDTYIKNHHLVLVMKNSFDGVVKMNGDELRTTKRDARLHGIGIGNMKRAIEKYDGYIVTNVEDRTFVLSVYMCCTALNEKAM